MKRSIPWAFTAVCIAAAIVGSVVQSRRAPLTSPRETLPSISGQVLMTVEHHVVPKALAPPQREAIANAARELGRHSVFIVASDGTAVLTYADSLADAFEAGGWTVEGRRHDQTRAVAHRSRLPNEPAVAVAPANGVGAAVRGTLLSLGLNPQPWVPSLPDASTDVRVWIGDIPHEQ